MISMIRKGILLLEGLEGYLNYAFRRTAILDNKGGGKIYTHKKIMILCT